jgi:hypothetical protein
MAGFRATNVYLTAHMVRGGHIHGDALVPRAFSAVTYKFVPKRHGDYVVFYTHRYAERG